MACQKVKPIAHLTPQYGTDGNMSHINNTSTWRDGHNFGTIAKRQTRWVITKNAHIVCDFALQPQFYPNPISPNSSGESLVLNNGAQTVFDYLDVQNVAVGRLDVIQILIKIVNGKKAKSGWSNPITLPRKGSCTRSFKSFQLKNFVSFSGKCLVPYSATI